MTYRGLNRGNGRAARIGGRDNPIRGDVPPAKQRKPTLAPFPLPRKLVEAVEAMDPTLQLE
jgi:hypothetical protein